MTPDQVVALLALIADLYRQVQTLQTRVADLEAQLAAEPPS